MRFYLFLLIILVTYIHNCQLVVADPVVRHALLVGIGKYPEESGWPLIHGDYDVERMREVLLKHNFYQRNIAWLRNENATMDVIISKLQDLSKAVSPGDVVYIHFSGHFQQVTDLDGDEADHLDEAFVSWNGTKYAQQNNPDHGHFTDDKLSICLQLIQENITSAGELILVLDGGFSSESKKNKFPLRGTNVSFRLDASLLNFRSKVEGSSRENELIDQNIINKQTPMVTLDAGEFLQNVEEVEFEGKIMGPLTATLVKILEAEKGYANFREAELAIKSEIKLVAPNLKADLIGMLDVRFLSTLPADRNAIIAKSKTHFTKSLSDIGNVYSLVIGVSQYSNKFNKLQYAHSDALAFQYFLKKAYGKKYIDNPEYLLIDKVATSSNIYGRLDELQEKVGPGDQVYFYFAGHGDVEGSGIDKGSFLILAEGNPDVYSAGGHISMDHLKRRITNYVFKGASVYLIIDACRSGSIANGTNPQDAYEKLKNLDQAAIKLLGCQSNEQSEESAQFGGGFGAFTYFLLKGLKGGADPNGDGKVLVGEIQKFLADSVAKATGQRQNPMVAGPVNHFVLPVWNALEPELLKNQALTESEALQASKPKDSLTISLEKKFYASLKNQNFVEPQSANAISLLKKLEAYILPGQIKLQPWRKDLGEALAAKLNHLIKEYTAGNESLSKDTVFGLAVREMDLYLDLISPKDLQYNTYLARRYFFKARAISPLKINNDLHRHELSSAIQSLRTGLQIEQNTSYIHNTMGRLFYLNRQFDSAIHHYRQAIRLAPRWKFPYNNLGATFNNIFLKTKELRWQDSALKSYNQALQIDPKYAMALKNKGKIYEDLNQIVLAKQTYSKAIFYNPRYMDSYHFLGDLYRLEGNWDSAFAILGQGLALSPTNVDLLQNMGNLHYDLAQNKPEGTTSKDSLLKLAKGYYLEATRVLPYYVYSNSGLSNVYFGLSQFDSSAYFALKCMALDSAEVVYGIFAADALLESKNLSESRKVLKQIDRRFPKESFHYFQWGLLWFREGNLPETMIAFRKAKNLGMEKKDFEGQPSWIEFKRSKAFKDWEKLWKK